MLRRAPKAFDPWKTKFVSEEFSVQMHFYNTSKFLKSQYV